MYDQSHQANFESRRFLNSTPLRMIHHTIGIPHQTHTAPVKVWNQPMPILWRSGRAHAVTPAPSRHRTRFTVAPAAAGKPGWRSMSNVVPTWQRAEAQKPKIRSRQYTNATGYLYSRSQP